MPSSLTPNLATAKSRWVPIVVELMLSTTIGCQFTSSTLDTTYGRSGKTHEAGAINGTSVLYGILEKQGHTVQVSRRWGRAVKKADTVVWFVLRERSIPDSMTLVIDEWLAEKSGRKLVIVLPGFDAARDYWTAQRTSVKPFDREYLAIRSEEAATVARLANREAPQENPLQLGRAKFTAVEPHRTQDLAGKWIARKSNSGRSHADFWLDGSFDADEGVTLQPLISAKGKPVVAVASSVIWQESELILVANGSFLLNLPLMDTRNQDLAQHLVQELSGGKRVVFLEADSSPSVSTGSTTHHMLAAFELYPINIVLLHATVAGILYCFAAYPIFGRPRELEQPRSTDFSLHTMAVGKLLGRVRDLENAQGHRNEWLKMAPRDT